MLNLGILIFLFCFIGAIGMVVIVKQQTAIIIERFGRFLVIRQAGLHFKFPLLDQVVGRISLKIQQLDVVIETKTKDNVFLHIKISVQFHVIKDKIYESFYKLENPHTQITSYVFDVVRAEVPKMRLDNVFDYKNDIAFAVKRELDEAMYNYGYSIIKALVTDIDPNEQVKQAMNRINTAEREKVAAEYEAEADRIKIVAKAKAEAESKQLQGKGIANQRREIAKGLLESVEVLNHVGISSQEASSLIVITQHYDTLHSMSEHTNTNLILLPNSPALASEMLNNMIATFNVSGQISDCIKNAKKKQHIKNHIDHENHIDHV